MPPTQYMTYPIPLPPLPSSPPYFCFFKPFMDAFLCKFVFYYMYTCIYMIFNIQYRIFDRFFEV